MGGRMFRNLHPWKPCTAGAVARNDALRASKYLDQALWRNWSGNHRRSRVQANMHDMKLLGQRLMARNFDRQVAEVQVRIAVLNGYTACGIRVTKAVSSTCLEKGVSCPSADSWNGVGRSCRLAHEGQLPRWIHDMNSAWICAT
jgi:hypothetical protein